MNDYRFGNYIYELRTRAKLSQAELAARVGVTNKAVSKWEVGRAKPSTDTVRKLAALFNVSVDEMLKIREEEKTRISPKSLSPAVQAPERLQQ